MSAEAISTEGFIAGSMGGDMTAPTIAVVSPTPSTPPGTDDGFPADFTSAAATPIIIDITDADPGVAFIVITNETSGEVTVFRGLNFLGDYIAEGSSDAISDGYELSILPSAGWPKPSDVTAQSFIKLRVDAIDGAGNWATASFVWTLPAPQTAVVPSSEPIEGIDHVALAIDRLAYQFRGNTGT
jgi:hypothetical protein